MNRLWIFICLFISTVAHGADWTLTTADFQKQSVSLQSLDESSLTIITQGGAEPLKIPLAQFLSIARNQPADAGSGAMVLHLRGGGRLVGTPVRLEGDNIIWRTRSVGEVPASLRHAQGITQGDQPLPPQQAGLRQDRVLLINGDRLDGIVADVDDGSLIMQVGTDAVPVPLDSITAVHFAQTGGSAGGDQPGFQLRLADGSIVASPTVRVAGNEVEAEIAGELRSVSLSGVVAIDQVNGPVAWLSDRAPAESVHTPFLGDPVSPRFNVDLEGRSVRIDNEPIGKLIAVHSRSRLTWELPDGYQRFRTRYAIDGDLPHANVTVRIYLDGKVVHEQADVTSGDPSPVVEIDLAGAQRITLEADYGRTYDVQDRLIWIEPALLRQGDAGA